jgi:hypothetical protein
MIFASPLTFIDQIDQDAPVTTTFDPAPDGEPIGVSHETPPIALDIPTQVRSAY